MKKKTITIKLSRFKYLLFLPILLLSFCESNLEGPHISSENKLTKDSKVFSLMKSAIQSDSDLNLIKSKGSLTKGATIGEDDQCTYFKYPMTFEVYSGDDPDPALKEINSDEELIVFIDAFTYEDEIVASTPNYELYIYFPITLLDTEGVETVLNNLTELEGTLQMAIEACESFDDDSSGGNDDDSNDSNDGSDDENSSDDDNDNDDGDNDDDDDGDDSNDSNDGSDDGNSSDDDDDDDNNDDGDNDGDDNDDDNYGDDDGDDGDDNDDGNDGDDDNGDDDDDNGDDDDDDGDDNDDNEDEVSNDGSNNDSNDDDKYCGKKNKKVYICHKGKTICVSVNAIWGHMQHHKDDYLGRCDD